MRISIVVAGLACASALAGCASTGGDDGASEYQTLRQDCEARGGVIKAIPGANNANDAANYSCEFRGASPKPAGG